MPNHTTNSQILQSLRLMAWERAKGEIESMFQTIYWTDNENDKRTDKLRKAFNDFVMEVEDNGLHE